MEQTGRNCTLALTRTSKAIEIGVSLTTVSLDQSSAGICTGWIQLIPYWWFDWWRSVCFLTYIRLPKCSQTLWLEQDYLMRGNTRENPFSITSASEKFPGSPVSAGHRNFPSSQNQGSQRNIPHRYSISKIVPFPALTLLKASGHCH